MISYFVTGSVCRGRTLQVCIDITGYTELSFEKYLPLCATRCRIGEQLARESSLEFASERSCRPLWLINVLEFLSMFAWCIIVKTLTIRTIYFPAWYFSWDYLWIVVFFDLISTFVIWSREKLLNFHLKNNLNSQHGSAEAVDYWIAFSIHGNDDSYSKQ